MKTTTLAALVLAATAVTAGVVFAQQAPYYEQRRGPMDDLLDQIIKDKQNSQMVCYVRRTLDRDGDIVNLQMNCRSEGWR
jgi:hypothetical protein